MSYVKQSWQNLPSMTTPTSAERFSYIEEGIFRAHQTADALAEAGVNAQQAADAAQAAAEAALQTAQGAVVKGALVLNVRDTGATGDGTTNDATAIQAALTGGNCIVLVPAGNYRITAPLRLYADTWLILHPDATVLNDVVGQEMAFVNGQLGNTAYAAGYGGDGNIRVTGGTVDNGPKRARSEFTEAFAFGHADNIVLDGVRMLNNYRSHFVEINACRNVTIRKCLFQDLDPAGDANREMINIDSASSAGFPQFGAYDNTMCDDVLIEDCTFRTGQVAVGSHSPTPAHRNIRIRNSRFYDMSGPPVWAKGWIGGGMTESRAARGQLQAAIVDTCTDFHVTGNELIDFGLAGDALHSVVVLSGGSGCYAGRNTIRNDNPTRYRFPYDVNSGSDHRIDTPGAALGSAGRIAENDGLRTVIDGATVLVLADDTAASIPMPGTTVQGLVFIGMHSAAAHSPRGLFWARTDATPTIVSITQAPAADLVLTTGPLAGTTGTDVKFTISAANDGRLYFENRTGVSRRLAVSFMLG